MNELSEDIWSEDMDNSGISFVCNLIGMPISVDDTKKYQHHIEFTRACVMISAKEKQKTRIDINMENVVMIKVEYEHLLAKCDKCGVLGHTCFN